MIAILGMAHPDTVQPADVSARVAGSTSPTISIPSGASDEYGSDVGDFDDLPSLPKDTKVLIIGNSRTKRVLVGLRGVVKKSVGLGGWHWLVSLGLTTFLTEFCPFLSATLLGSSICWLGFLRWALCLNKWLSGASQDSCAQVCLVCLQPSLCVFLVPHCKSNDRQNDGMQDLSSVPVCIAP